MREVLTVQVRRLQCVQVVLEVFPLFGFKNPNVTIPAMPKIFHYNLLKFTKLSARTDSNFCCTIKVQAFFYGKEKQSDCNANICRITIVSCHCSFFFRITLKSHKKAFYSWKRLGKYLIFSFLTCPPNFLHEYNNEKKGLREKYNLW